MRRMRTFSGYAASGFSGNAMKSPLWWVSRTISVTRPVCRSHPASSETLPGTGGRSGLVAAKAWRPGFSSSERVTTGGCRSVPRNRFPWLISPSLVHVQQHRGHLALKVRVTPLHVIADLVRSHLPLRQNLMRLGAAQLAQLRVAGRDAVLLEVSPRQPLGPQLVGVAQILGLLTSAV